MIATLKEYTWAEREAMQSEDITYILPISALEQHGRHLPLGTDDDILQTVLEGLRADTTLRGRYLCLPAIHYGCSREHMDFCGTVTLSNHVMEGLIEDILASAQRHQVKRVVIINSHGGNAALIEANARHWEQQFGLRVYMLSFFHSGFFRDGVLPLQTPVALDIHAGEIETSILLHRRPELVRTDQIRGEYDCCSGTCEFIPGWSTAELSPGNGVLGAPSLASAEKGEAIFHYMVDRIRDFLRELERKRENGEEGKE